MTSRDYIYARARDDLKRGAFPLFNESQVVIDVHDLSAREREQILYNHLKLGAQPSGFKAQIKPHLPIVSAHARFVPEIARRLSDPAFTKRLYLSEYHLREFVEKREQLLQEAEDKLKSNGIVEDGDLIVLTIGEPIGKAGGTNTMKIVRVGESRAR
jgi:hypothetical protein